MKETVSRTGRVISAANSRRLEAVTEIRRSLTTIEFELQEDHTDEMAVSLELQKIAAQIGIVLGLDSQQVMGAHMDMQRPLQ